ncbi:glycosyl hydrolase [Henriciella litoralis]|uniref:glycosyl hydrolase n=1 Tax=Henriciella litoralis TaxID=568102 RepID=UPI00146E1D01|nr:glycosyl hydrolase [Henriciella litoralis]
MRILKWTGIGFSIVLGLGVCAGGAGYLLAQQRIKAAMAPPEADPAPSSLTAYLDETVRPQASPQLYNPQTLSSLADDALLNEKARPWTRWWWPGGDVDAETACAQLADLHNAGFGGVEIQPFNAGLAIIEDETWQARINSFDSEDYYATLSGVMSCAKRLDMQVYLNHLSGWPAGGPEVPVTEGMKEIRYAEKRVKGGRAITIELPAPEPNYNDTSMAVGEIFFGADLSNFVPEERQILAVLAATPVAGKHASNPLDVTDTVQLAPDSVVDLSSFVDGDRLNWDAPKGNWSIIAIYTQPAGEAPTLIASDRSGYVIDHLDADIVAGHYGYAYGPRTGLEEFYGDPFMGVFNDSLEFKLDRLGAADILEEFKKRRGYDLTPHLPAIFIPARDNFFLTEVGRQQPAPSFSLDETDERIRHDYQKTVSDLIVERFANASADWAEARGLVSKAQTYGSDFDVLAAMGQNTMPETEQLFAGGSEYALKLATSGAELYDRPIVSAESFVWYKLAYAVSPEQIKAAADKLFLSGVNQIIYHGIPYVPQDDAYSEEFGDLGWYPFSGPENDSNFSGNYGPASPVWEVLPELNAYLTRAQSLLKAGHQRSDLFIYYPFLGFPHQIEDSDVFSEEFLFMGALPGEAQAKRDEPISIPFSKLPERAPEDRIDPRLRWLEQIRPLTEKLNEAGITWSWINDDGIARFDPSTNDKARILIADAPWIERATLEALTRSEDMADRITISGAPPRRQPGFLDFEGNDAWIAQTAAAFASNGRPDTSEEFIDWLAPALRLDQNETIRHYARYLAAGTEIHFLVNQSRDRHTALAVPARQHAHAYWFDAAAGEAWDATPIETGAFEVDLSGLQSRFLIFSDEAISGIGAAPDAITNSIKINGPWTIRSGELTLDDRTSLPDLRTVDGFRHADQPLVYSTAFELETDAPCPCPAQLSLGRVEGVVQLRVNGEDFPPAGLAPMTINLGDALQPGRNTLAITIKQPRRNELVGKALAGDPLLKQVLPQQEELAPMGLFGPVQLELLAPAQTPPLATDSE